LECRWKTLFGHARERRANAVDLLYPDRPAEPRPSTVDISNLTGTYYDRGYGAITFRVEEDAEDESKLVLVADRPEMTWRYRYLLRHVTSDYWVMWTWNLANPKSFMSDFAKAEFVFGVDGSVSALKVAMASNLGEYHDEGTVVFDKVA
jgi:hypothetical protein